MAIPSASETEVIKHNQVVALSTTAVLLIPSPTANHIYTVLSIIWTETAGAAEQIYLNTFTDSGLSANEFWLLRDGAIPAYGTFVWSDRFSFSGALYLATKTGSAANIDCHITYIDQNWA